MVRTLIERSTERELRFLMPYEAYQEQIDESIQSEWVDGEVTIFMPPSDRHQDILLFLAAALRYFLDLTGLGIVRPAPFEMKLRAGRSYREPDIVVLLNANRNRLSSQRITGPADLVVEILSPESVVRDRSEKLQEYAKAGVSEYWLVDARNIPSSITGYILNNSGNDRLIEPDESGRYFSAVLPGFWIEDDWFSSSELPLFPDLFRTIDRVVSSK